ncbi:SagB/ThcOx family dehydrogenase [Anoxybacillus flavithermus]|uniref:SagB/ThcOx family dehydrogenase n=1 Tax=Anoxybacillus TaxID=150247 RepID=UPI00038631B9|nr:MULTISPECIES: SagB/ThcOx family dehydrogenase [Anoxybacillus]ASA97405.1 NADH oxidase [Anoxybacillus flavithermus]EPZ37210.1 NADH oxidase [Anoxybacillus ayderensis]MBE2905457.1 SagB/ThcOx family dehydrogenase [Anoxybacillus flavithermus]MBE2920014.1 SagB/ThcOx family dehydrogenase [Anoxybacillus flavithermus]MBE2921956.1 SagB/ThcOx family dehydrogenase [Anoxybacillus flavithermus]
MEDIYKYKLAPDLVITYVNRKPQLRIPSQHRRFEVDSKVMSVVSAFTGNPEETSHRLEKTISKNTIQAIVNKLIDVGVLISANEQKQSQTSEIVMEWAEWGESTWFVHLESRDANYKSSDEVGEEFMESSGSPPPTYKCNCEKSNITLPKPSTLSNMTISDALTLRRTYRNFLPESIKLQELSDLLYYTGGILFTNSTRFFGRVAKKVAPSPGGRHATELYPVINNCEGLERGIYHYCQKHHALHLLSKMDDVKSFLGEALYGQDYFLDASVTVFYTSVIDRIKWKYKGARIYRLMHYETAHYAQNFLLAGTAHNLGVFTTAAFKESLVESKLGIDGVHEVAMYVTGAGQKDEIGPYARAGIELSENVPADFKIALPKALSSTAEQKLLG